MKALPGVIAAVLVAASPAAAEQTTAEVRGQWTAAFKAYFESDGPDPTALLPAIRVLSSPFAFTPEGRAELAEVDAAVEAGLARLAKADAGKLDQAQLSAGLQKIRLARVLRRRLPTARQSFLDVAQYVYQRRLPDAEVQRVDGVVRSVIQRLFSKPGDAVVIAREGGQRVLPRQASLEPPAKAELRHVVSQAVADLSRGQVEALRRELSQDSDSFWSPESVDERLVGAALREASAAALSRSYRDGAGRLVGGVVATYDRSYGAAQIQALRVEASFRRAGLTRRLVRDLALAAQAQGIERVEVFVDEEGAAEFEALGFSPASRQTFGDSLGARTLLEGATQRLLEGTR